MPYFVKNGISPFNINLLQSHISVGAIVDIKLRFHELPLPGGPVSTFSLFVVPA
jgi:hypothetical protein